MKQKGTSDLAGKVVVVAVKAARDIPRTALVWALTHVVQPGDCIKLLVVIPALSSSNLLYLINTSPFTFICFLLTFLMMIQVIELIGGLEEPPSRIKYCTGLSFIHLSTNLFYHFLMFKAKTIVDGPELKV